MPLILYSVSDGPPSLAVQQCLKYLNIDYKLVNVDFGVGEHMTEEFELVSVGNNSPPTKTQQLKL